jgi:hypothetical protein
VVSLIDRGSEVPTEVLTETLDEGDASFAGKEGAVSVLAGHTYAISLEVKTTAVAALGLLAATANARFDNVSLSVEGSAGETAGGDGKDGGGGGGGPAGSGGVAGSPGGSSASSALTTSELLAGMRRGDAPSAGLLGQRVFVRLRCPEPAERACRISAQGRIKKRVRVTQRRTIRVSAGRSRLVALRVKPRFREKVAQRKRPLVVQEVRVGKVTTTYARSRVLVRRG